MHGQQNIKTCNVMICLGNLLLFLISGLKKEHFPKYSPEISPLCRQHLHVK